MIVPLTVSRVSRLLGASEHFLGIAHAQDAAVEVHIGAVIGIKTGFRERGADDARSFQNRAVVDVDGGRTVGTPGQEQIVGD